MITVRADRGRAILAAHVGRAVFLLTLLAVAVGTGAAADHAGAHGREAAGSTPFAAMMQDAMTTMDDGMMSARMTDDPDHDFAAMMIPHHQGAVEMAKAELLHGKDPVLRRLAQEIIVTQNSEITLMQSELQKMGAGASH